MISFRINKKRNINKKSPAFIIAEIGINHEGNFALARKMIKAAFDTGADAVKLQIVFAEESYAKDTNSYKMFKKATLNEKEYKELFKEFKNRETLFATPGDFSSLNICESLDIPLYKISSGLLSNIPLVLEINRTKKPLIISTGMAKVFEINKVLDNLKYKKKNKIALLHCNSLYPTPIEKINLNSIRFLENQYNRIIGFSDHTLGWEASILAVASGARIIEKHFTIDNKRESYDHKISLDPKSFKRMIQDIRRVESILGDFNKKPLDEEIKNKKNIQRYCVAKENINKGDKFTKNNVMFKRLKPSNLLIKAFDFSIIENKKANASFLIDEPITL